MIIFDIRKTFQDLVKLRTEGSPASSPRGLMVSVETASRKGRSFDS
jgi:hypothetical protein